MKAFKVETPDGKTVYRTSQNRTYSHAFAWRDGLEEAWRVGGFSSSAEQCDKNARSFGAYSTFYQYRVLEAVEVPVSEARKGQRRQAGEYPGGAE